MLALGVGQPDVGRRDSDSTRSPQALLSMLHIRTPTHTHTRIYVIIWHGVSVSVCVCENNKHKMHKYTHRYRQITCVRMCVCECGGKLKAYQFQCLAPHAFLLDLLLLYLCSLSSASCALPLSLSSTFTSVPCTIFCLFFATGRAHLPAIISQCGAHLSAIDSRGWERDERKREWRRERGRKGELSRKSNW